MPNVTPLRRTQQERRDASEDVLLTAAAELIAESGVIRASFAKIGARAGTSSGLPIHHFGTKDRLLARVAHRAQERLLARLETVLARSGHSAADVSALGKVRAMVHAYLELFDRPSASDRAFIVLWGSQFPSRSSIDGMAYADRYSHEGWMELVKAGQRDGSIRSGLDPAATATLLTGLTRGVAALELTQPGLAGPGQLRATCDAFITAALASPDDHRKTTREERHGR